MTNVSRLPGDVNISLDLDAVERPAEDVKPPFVVQVGGKAVTMTDPAEFDWEDLLDIQNPQDFLRYCLNDEDREHFRNTSFPGWKLNVLMESYMKHYDLDKRMRQAQEEERRAGRARI
jgi:hypothetical protein